MKLLVGLGNPGAAYAGNRHNIGYMAVDRIAAAHGFGPWRARFKGQLAEGVLAGEKVWLLKPATYMNLSGQSVGEAMRYLKLTPANLIVFHDELDLAPGKCRLKAGGGHAGHNGLRSLHAHIGDAYARVRLGIGHPGDKDRVADYVLSDFAKADAGWCELLLDAIAEGAPALVTGNGAEFLNAIAQRMAPPRPPKAPRGAEADARVTVAAPEVSVPDARPEATPAGEEKGALQRLVERFRR